MARILEALLLCTLGCVAVSHAATITVALGKAPEEFNPEKNAGANTGENCGPRFPGNETDSRFRRH